MSKSSKKLRHLMVGASVLAVISGAAHAAPPSLFETTGPAAAPALAHGKAAQSVRLNRRALEAPSIAIDLFGETVVAVRDRVERQKAGTLVWVGHLEGNLADAVVITARGSTFAGVIQRGGEVFEIAGGPGGGNSLVALDLESLPLEDLEGLPDGGGAFEAAQDGPVTAEENVVQDLLVVYTQAACNYYGSCAQLESAIVTAVADMNTAYAESGIGITSNLVGMAFTNYSEPSSASTALSNLAGTSDGQMDEIHPLRDSLGADIVSLVYDGPGCGIGYLGSSASSAFNVTDVPCLVGNRTMAHEIGHNQGAHHDRVTAGAGSSTSFNYGYRRCNDGSVDDVGSPYFRTVLAYPCGSSPRVGRFSNPNVNYSGVPQGIDPAAEPNNGSYNAQTLNNSASYMAGFRNAQPQTPPAAPTGLSASASGFDTIDLVWSDNSNNEDSFLVQSSGDQVTWTTIAQLAANTTSYTDNGLNPDTTYFYRTRALNAAGGSNFSNVASATTDPAPSEIVSLAQSDNPSSGTISGDYTATRADDGTVQTITEVSTGGPKRSRRQSYTHGWSFSVPGGAGGVILTANAWVSGAEGANFYYSRDGGASWDLMFTVDETSSASVKTFQLPGDTSGTVLVEARDAEQSNGEPEDQLFVDHLFITSYTTPGQPPANPTNMAIAGVTASSVSMSFTDNASDEFGFEIWRSTSDPAGNCNAGGAVDTLGANGGTGSVAYTDMTAASATTYWYWAKAYNGAGDNGLCSNAASATTNAAAAISASANGYKVKGEQTVDLAWSGASGTNVDIRRDGAVVATTANDGAYTDNIGVKGGGAYAYEVCNAGSATQCSDPINVVF